MSRRLPARPHLDHLKSQAKALRKACDERQGRALARVAAQRHQTSRDPASKVSLQTAQLVVAREYGFKSWRDLVAAVQTREHANELNRLVIEGDVEAIRKRLDGGLSLGGLTDVWGWRLLHVAALRGKVEVARLLWERDADRSSRTLRRALDLAMQSGHQETIRYFLEQGAVEGEARHALYRRDVSALRTSLAADASQLSAIDEDGNTLLHTAANLDFGLAARLLVDAGAHVETRNRRGETPLFRSISNNAERVARVLLAAGADVNTVTDYGQNCLHCAASTYKPRLVELLRASGIDRRFEDIHVMSALGRLDGVEALATDGPALVNDRDPFGNTPLHLAVAGKHAHVAAALLSRGADPNAVSKQGRTPLLLAKECKNKDLAELLKRHGALQ